MVQITMSSTVVEARAALAEAAQPAIVVWDDREPIGVVTLDDVSEEGTGGLGPESLIVDVMSHECVAIDATADLEETHHRYADAAWTSLKRRRPFSQDTLDRRATTAGVAA